MKDIELKTCPFCGGEAKLHIQSDDCMKEAIIICEDCGVNSRIFSDIILGDFFIDEITKAWNRRVLDKEKDSHSVGAEQEPGAVETAKD